MPEISSTGSFPNFPRFRVDEEEKCDPSILNVLGEETFWRRDLSIYPNPASEFITLEIPDTVRGDLFVLDMNGQLILHQEEFSCEGELDISFLNAGVYSVEFVPQKNDKKIIYTHRLVKVD